MPTEYEQRFAATLTAAGLAEDRDIARATKVAEALRKRGKYADIRTVLVGRADISDENAETALAQIGAVPMFCGVCGGKYQVDPYDTEATCPGDGSPLKVVLAPDAMRETITPSDDAMDTMLANPDPDDPLAGKKFGAFKLIGVIGQDSKTKTLLAKLPNSDLKFAVKVLATSDAVARRRFRREARYTGLISHPNVIHVLGSGEEGALCWLAMEYVPGPTVDRLIGEAPNGQLELTDAVDIACQVLEGLDAAHHIGVVHRNIKPPVIVVAKPHVKVTNFSSARITDTARESIALTQQGTSLGTPQYMAPEQIGSSRVNFRADIYALGSTLYHMLCGRPPYTGKNMAAIFDAKLRNEPPLPSTFNPLVRGNLENAIMRMLARDPEHRPKSAAHAAKEVRDAM